LTIAVQQWPSPRAEDAESAGAHRGVPDTLTSATRWGTPQVADGKNVTANGSAYQLLAKQVWTTPRANHANVTSSDMKRNTPNLACQVWSTPTVNLAKNATSPPSQQNRNDQSLAEEVMVPPTHRLNAAWVAQLMGWQNNWFGLPLEVYGRLRAESRRTRGKRPAP
jgi:hypothetical protein